MPCPIMRKYKVRGFKNKSGLFCPAVVGILEQFVNKMRLLGVFLNHAVLTPFMEGSSSISAYFSLFWESLSKNPSCVAVRLILGRGVSLIASVMHIFERYKSRWQDFPKDLIPAA